MTLLAIVDIVSVLCSCLITGWLAYQGAVYCTYPNLIYIVGMAEMGLWSGSCVIAVILVTNRLLDLILRNLGSFVFGGNPIALGVFSYCGVDNLVFWVICDYKLNIPKGCVTLDCIGNNCHLTYFLSYEMANRLALFDISIIFVFDVIPPIVLTKFPTVGFDDVGPIFSFTKMSGYSLEGYLVIMYVLIGTLSIILFFRLFIWNNCKKGAKNKAISRATWISLLDSFIIFAFDFFPVFLTAQWPDINTKTVGPLGSLCKQLGLVIESFVVCNVLLNKKVVPTTRSQTSPTNFPVVY
ncbi:Protein CBG06328 [Caenorhabditis briggsae]|uniref:Protein CBG06328 n=1 Tax=Caenorhabditis briggsae TaxID=6238 RepID=A8X1Z2_CAEBR|nr:Protein CBG06328 [Caenorhabditis briggsae]CAP26652.1 Protein CBG06328 [Caenorhabditis briggsae]